jgi:hypothetical protein
LNVTTVQLSDEQIERISQESINRGESQSATIRRALDQYFLIADLIRKRLVTPKRAIAAVL